MPTNRAVDIALPLKGLNTIDPHGPWNSGYARELTNYSIFNGRLYVRPAVRSLYSGSGFRQIHWMSAGASDYYAILDDGAIRTVVGNAGATSIGGNPQANAYQVKHATLDLVIGCLEPRDAAHPFTAWTFTTAGIVATGIVAACSHRGRLYVSDGSTIEYSDLAAVTGTLNGAGSYASLMDNQSIIRMFSVTASPGNLAENVLAMFGDDGRVLVYQGDYPGSPTWTLIGKFDMPAPISNVGFVEIDGDIWVATEQYAYWFSELFNGGARAAYARRPTAPIENLWQSCAWRWGDPLVQEQSHSFYEPYLDAIITQCFSAGGAPNDLFSVADYNNEGVYFAYFRKYGAWALWLMTPFFTPVIRSESTLIATAYSRDLVTLTSGSMVDIDRGTTEIPIETSWKSPYLRQGRAIKLGGIRPYFENSLTGYLEKVRAIFDRTDFNAPLGFYTQSTVTAIDPGIYADASADLDAATWDQYSPHIGLSGSGDAVSIQFTQKQKSGSSATQSQSLYGATIYIEEGSGI